MALQADADTIFIRGLKSFMRRMHFKNPSVINKPIVC